MMKKIIAGLLAGFMGILNIGCRNQESAESVETTAETAQPQSEAATSAASSAQDTSAEENTRPETEAEQAGSAANAAVPDAEPPSGLDDLDHQPPRPAAAETTDAVTSDGVVYDEFGNLEG